MDATTGATIDAAQERAAAYERAAAIIATLELPDQVSLCATGSFARQEMTPHSDLDLLVIIPEDFDAAELSELWYPIWDAKFHLDAAIRTPTECLQIIGEDPTAAFAMLDARFLRGDAQLYERTYQQLVQRWRREVSKQFNVISDTAISRWRRSGSVVAMTRPDIKNGRGGLRDYDLLRALALANLCDIPDLSSAHTLLLDVRTLLHKHARRNRDQLDPEFAVDIAIDLGYKDRYELVRAVATAAHSIDKALTQAMQAARNVLPKKQRFRTPIRRPLDVDVVEINGEIALSRQPDLTDPTLVLRVAAASARTGLPIGQQVWQQLEQLPPLPQPWPRSVASDFFALLSSPTHTPSIVADLDEHGFWEQFVPEWAHARNLMPHEPTHVHTVDQHNLVVVSLCAEQSVRVARPDLLLLAALYHDLGKGYDRPHAEVGAAFISDMAQRLGLSPSDRSVLATVVLEHTTIPRLVSSSDITDPQVAEQLLDRIRYNALTLNLLEVLSECDAIGTGPGVWTKSLERGTAYLCRAARAQLDRAEPAPPVVEPGPQLALWPVDAPRRSEEETPAGLEAITAPFAMVHFENGDIAGLQQPLAVIAAKGWNIEEAHIVVENPSCATTNGTPATSQTVRANFRVYNLLGSGFVEADFIQSYKSGVHTSVPPVPPSIVGTLWRDDFVEVRCSDHPASLATLLTALPPVQWVRARTVGATVIAQCKLCPGFDRVKVERAIVHALSDAPALAGF